MELVLDLLLCMCLTFSQLSPFTPIVYKLNKTEVVDNNEANPVVNVPSTEVVIEEDETEKELKASNFITLDMEGYCTLNIPLSHFTLNSENSTPTHKQADYYDNRTRLYMGYITDMEESTDIPGYISNEVAGVQTVTNDKTTITYGNSDWVRIKADHVESGCNVYIYYTLSKDKTSAFWIRAKVDENSDNEVFHTIMEQTLSTYYLYAVTGTIFDTPTTGFYAEYDDETVADTSDYEANSDKNNVFKSRGGYVMGADISDNWEDLDIILDGTKFTLPCSVSEFETAGFEMNDISVEDERDLQVYSNQTSTLTYKNKNGTVVKLTVLNDDAGAIKVFRDCQVMAIAVDAEKLIDIALTKEDEVYNEETAASDMTATNAKDDYNHELILPGGITWGVYGDDLKAYYGMCFQTEFDTDTSQFRWESGNKQMIIRTGIVCEIKYVYLSCMEVE